MKYITNIDTISALLDRLVTENIKLYFFNKDNLIDKIDHQIIVIEEIKKKLTETLSSIIKENKYDYISEKRTYSEDDILESIEELIFSDITTGEGDRDNLKEATSDNPNLDKFVFNHKKIRKANERRASAKNKIDERFKDIIENGPES